jgi:hypothetical protein
MSTHLTRAQLIERAQDDAAFRAALLENPAATIAAELGAELPATLNVRVVEEGAEEIVLVLPASSRPTVVEEAELAAAAGGCSYLADSRTLVCTNAPFC